MKKRSWWTQRYGLVEVLSVSVAGALLVWAWKAPSGDKISWVVRGNRSAIYTMLGSIEGALLGFVITALSIVLTLGSDKRLAILRQAGHLRRIYSVFTGAIWPFALATVVSIAALLTDRDMAGDRPPHVATPIAIACALTTVLAACRLARSIGALVDLIEIVVTRSEQALDVPASSGHSAPAK